MNNDCLVKLFCSKASQCFFFIVAEVTAYDGEIISYYLDHTVTHIPHKSNLLSLDSLSEFQRQQMDLNSDWLKDNNSSCSISKEYNCALCVYIKWEKVFFNQK